ncbi:hypothetical protein KIL84_008575, partial [Mauremys mutica]
TLGDPVSLLKEEKKKKRARECYRHVLLVPDAVCQEAEAYHDSEIQSLKE